MEIIDFFNSVGYLNKKCPKCSARIEYGITTKFDKKLKSHVCKECGEKV